MDIKFIKLLKIVKKKHPQLDVADLEYEFIRDGGGDDNVFVSKLRNLVINSGKPSVAKTEAKRSREGVELAGEPSYDPQVKLKELQEKGVTVIPVAWMNAKKRWTTRSIFKDQVSRFPEFKPGATQFVLGGFSALGNPSSFHNVFARRIRQYAMVELMPLFRALVESQDDPQEWKLEQIIDRMMWRPAGVTATAESWHRDESTLAKDDDLIFGGWWNFDDTPQGFSVVLGTHKGVRGHSGFAAIKDKELKKKYTAAKTLVEIPPGHIMIFYEHLIHEVLAKKKKNDQFRQFLGWRVTKEVKSLYPLEDKLANQAVMPLKSNQTPPMYAVLHWCNWRSKLVTFTELNIKDLCTEQRAVKSGADKGKTFKVVHREMKSLKEYGLPMYPKYGPRETSLYTPGHTWEIFRGVDDKKIKVSLDVKNM